MSETDDPTIRLQQLEAENRRLQKALYNLERSYDITIEAFGKMFDQNRDSKGHTRRVTAFTIAMARALGMSKEQIGPIARGAFLQDVGEIGMPGEILRRPDTLTPDETALVRQHCWRGYQMLKNIPFLSEAAEIVYAHHERFDGQGYPRGLKGAQIPLGARLVAVADTLEAITSERPYRAASLEEARQVIQTGSGHAFDPDVVSTFLSMPVKIWDDLRRDLDPPPSSPDTPPAPSGAPLTPAPHLESDAAALTPEDEP